MIASVDFVPRNSAVLLQAAEDVAVISIKGPLDVPLQLAPFGRLLCLEFQDINSPEGIWAFDKNHAAKIIDFVASLHSETTEYHCIVHCKAGVSRSAAIALYVASATGCVLLRRDQASGANPLVLRVLGEMAGLTITF